MNKIELNTSAESLHANSANNNSHFSKKQFSPKEERKEKNAPTETEKDIAEA